MPRRAFVPFALALCGAPLCAQTTDLAAKAADLQTRLVASRAQLATAAFDAGLLREASTLAQLVLAGSPEHELGKRLVEVKSLTGEQYVDTYKRAVAKSGREWRKQAAKTLEPLAEEMATLGLAALAAGEAARGEELLVGAFRVDSDNRAARRALEKLDYDTIFNYGVLPKDDKQAARSALRKLSGRFLERRDLQDELEFWSDAWGLQTRHYRFVTNAPHETVFAFAQACEDLHAAWEEFMDANRQPLRKLSKPLRIFLFGSAQDYENVLRLAGEEPFDSEETLGFYSPTDKTGHFYYDHEFYAGDLTLLCETFFHEGAHQLIDLRLKAAWRGRADERPLHWVEEGLCVYLESLVAADGKFTFGTIVDDDLQSALAAAAAGELMPTADFAHISDEGWDAYELGYPHAALLVHWLMHGDEGRRRGVLFELLAAERQHGGMRKGTFVEAVGLEPAAVDAALVEYAAHLAKTLTVRRYAEAPQQAEPAGRGGR